MSSTHARSHAFDLPGYTESLPCKPESVHRARRLVSTALLAWGMGELVDDGTLIVSELLTNAINHTPSRKACVTVQRRSGDIVRIGVTDASPDLPDIGDPGDDSVRGRGLLMVDALSWRWGHERRRQGKAVWAELRLPGPLPTHPREQVPLMTFKTSAP
ncbi:ATP-binding protein [Streptomyces prasinus]|uniref:ATP-binding protein n=1 Tax=Streptomyces prasinus TaxID=67345 RepID=UPI00367F1A81